MAVNIQLEWTPNPSTLKYVTDVRLLPRGALQFTDPEMAAAQSPLAHKLMGLTGVTAVMIGKTFVTITKGEEGEWDELNDAVLATMQEHLDAGEVVVLPEALEAKEAAGGGEVETRIRDILEAEIRPAVMMDGGDITLERFEQGIVYLNMKGSCSGCPSSTMTLKMGIEERLRQEIPEVQEVVAL
ncbi:MAG: NifU family protein [Myxococcota bacterium]